jgi:hypothetical protein
MAGQTRSDDLAVQAEKLPGCTPPTLSRPFKCAVLLFAILAFFVAHPALQIFTIANEQGVSEESRWTAPTERATAWSTTHFSASEADVLRERGLQNRCASHLSIFEACSPSPLS